MVGIVNFDAPEQGACLNYLRILSSCFVGQYERHIIMDVAAFFSLPTVNGREQSKLAVSV